MPMPNDNARCYAMQITAATQFLDKPCDASASVAGSCIIVNLQLYHAISQKRCKLVRNFLHYNANTKSYAIYRMVSFPVIHIEWPLNWVSRSQYFSKRISQKLYVLVANGKPYGMLSTRTCFDDLEWPLTRISRLQFEIKYIKKRCKI